jgi:hypothetical protein
LSHGPDGRLGRRLRRWAERLYDVPSILLPVDGDELERFRRRQAVYLSRYGSEPIGSWDTRSVWELDAHYAEMNALIGRENGD